MINNIRREWEAQLSGRGRSVLVHTRRGDTDPMKRKAVALRAEPPTQKVQAVFQFSDSLGIAVGVLIQPDGREEFWEVVNVVDRIVGGEYVCHEARVRKSAAPIAVAAGVNESVAESV